jgi:hypothetical protein
MYAYGYNKPMAARRLLTEIGLKNNPCTNCPACKVTCTKRFNIKDKIGNILRVLDVSEEFLA